MRLHPKAGLCAVVAIVMFAPWAAASADSGDTVRGGCGFTGEQSQLATGSLEHGFIYDLSASQEASGGPSGATVQCWIEENGVEVPDTRVSASGDGIQATVAPIAFASADDWGLCQQVTFDDGSTWDGFDGANPDCTVPVRDGVPPDPEVLGQRVEELTNGVVTTAHQLVGVVDAIACPTLIQLGLLSGGGVAGAILIGPDGDVSVAQPFGAGYVKEYDCPPY